MAVGRSTLTRNLPAHPRRRDAPSQGARHACQHLFPATRDTPRHRAHPHAGARRPVGRGKTSLAEALLHQAGAIGAPGSLERGTTVSDYDPMERRAQHSLNTALMHLEHGGTRIHLLDTPGYPISSASR